MTDANQRVDPQTVLSFMREQCTDLSAKINELDLEKTEHQLVINTLKPLAADRKCFRMIGDVVVERRRRPESHVAWPQNIIEAVVGDQDLEFLFQKTALVAICLTRAMVDPSFVTPMLHFSYGRHDV